MYNKVFNINILNKIIFLLIILIVNVFSQNIYLIYCVTGLLMLISISTNKNIAFLFVATSGILIFFRDYYSILEIIYRLTLSISVIILFICSFNKTQKGFFLERFFYSNPRRSKLLINLKYGDELLKENSKMYLPLKEILLPYNKYSNYINKQIYIKKENNVNDIYLYSRLRFYNYFKKRRYLNKNTWTIVDNTVLLLSVMLVLLLVIWR